MSSLRTTAFTSGFTGLAPRASTWVAPKVSRRNVAATPSTVRMVNGSIDFSKVNLAGAGENLAGLVFTPETGGVVTETRVGGLGYSEEQASALNKHINVEYTAMYAYHALSAYFDRDTVALPGFSKYFNEESKEEREHADEFIRYQNKRGGKVELFPIAVPEMSFTQEDGASDALYAMDLALQLEKFVYVKLQHLHKVAEDASDAAMMDFVEGYLGHQVDAIKKAADYVAQIKRVGTGHGIYHMDRVLLDEDCA